MHQPNCRVANTPMKANCAPTGTRDSVLESGRFVRFYVSPARLCSCLRERSSQRLGIRHRYCRHRDSRYRGANLDARATARLRCEVVLWCDPEVRRWRSILTVLTTACSRSCSWVGTMVSAFGNRSTGRRWNDCKRSLISDPVGRAKSVVLTDEGLDKTERLFRGPVRDKPVSKPATKMHLIFLARVEVAVIYKAQNMVKQHCCPAILPGA